MLYPSLIALAAAVRGRGDIQKGRRGKMAYLRAVIDRLAGMPASDPEPERSARVADRAGPENET